MGSFAHKLFLSGWEDGEFVDTLLAAEL
jgi:hypothetical protein